MGQGIGRLCPFVIQQNIFQEFIGLIFHGGKMEIVFPEVETHPFPALDGNPHIFKNRENGKYIGQLKRPTHPDARPPHGA